MVRNSSCTDGITRHHSRSRASALVNYIRGFAYLCSELKRICYERGAEDNLRPWCVRWPTLSANDRVDDLERTMSPDAPPAASVAAARESQTMLGSGFDSLPSSPDFGNSLDDTEIPAARAESIAALKSRNENPIENRLDVPGHPPARSRVERTMTRFFMFVLFLAVVGAAFYAGRKYKGPIPYVDSATPVRSFTDAGSRRRSDLEI